MYQFGVFLLLGNKLSKKSWETLYYYTNEASPGLQLQEVTSQSQTPGLNRPATLGTGALERQAFDLQVDHTGQEWPLACVVSPLGGSQEAEEGSSRPHAQPTAPIWGGVSKAQRGPEVLQVELLPQEGTRSKDRVHLGDKLSAFWLRLQKRIVISGKSWAWLDPEAQEMSLGALSWFCFPFMLT